MKIDNTVRRETVYIALWTVVLSALMEAVFLILGKWHMNVLLGNLLGGAVAVVNFLLMGITVQYALKKNEKDAANTMKASQGARTLLLFVTAVLGATLSVFNLCAVLVPLFFPRLAIALRPLFDKEKSKDK